MKSRILIKFPNNRKLKDILISGSLSFEGDMIILDIDKKANDKETYLANHQYHLIEGIRLESINRNIHPDMLKDYQVFHFSGYYRNTKIDKYVKCTLEYSINNFNLKLK